MRPLDVLMSPAEQRLAGAVLLDPDREFGTVELLDRMGSSRSAGSALLKRWVEGGVLRERRVGNQRRLSANPQFLLYPELRRMALKTVGLAEPLARALAPLAASIRQACIVGSIAAGTDTSSSDVDLVLVGDLTLFDVSPVLDAAQAELGRPIHVSLYGPQEWASETDPVISALRQGPRLDLTEALHAQTR